MINSSIVFVVTSLLGAAFVDQSNHYIFSKIIAQATYTNLSDVNAQSVI